jgi:hypothetical protein
MHVTAPSSPAVQTILTLGPLNGGPFFFHEIAHPMDLKIPLHPPLIHHHWAIIIIVD